MKLHKIQFSIILKQMQSFPNCKVYRKFGKFSFIYPKTSLDYNFTKSNLTIAQNSKNKWIVTTSKKNQFLVLLFVDLMIDLKIIVKKHIKTYWITNDLGD